MFQFEIRSRGLGKDWLCLFCTFNQTDEGYMKKAPRREGVPTLSQIMPFMVPRAFC